MKQNQGYTLIELIVVIAVIAVLAFGTVMGSGMLGGYRVQKCVDDIDGALNETLVNAMSREACTLTLSRDAEGRCYLQMTGRQKEKIADKSITISYGKSGFTGKTKLSFTEPLILSYERSSGAFLPIITNIRNAESGYYIYLTAGGTDVYCTDITVSMGARTSSTIRLTRETGKHYIE